LEAFDAADYNRSDRTVRAQQGYDMLRGIILVFLAGWIIWFWIDKSPGALGPLPYPADGEYLHNFQVAVDLLKQTRLKGAFVYLWKAHYILLSVAAGVLIGALLTSISRRLSRSRFLALYLPRRKQAAAKRSDNDPAE
jgi:hypothetical protein